MGTADDTFGIAGVVNGISGEHQAFLNAGGLGILIGDGMLPHPGPEQIIETYYSFPLSFWRVTLRLSVHRQSRLQPRPRAGLGARGAAARAVLRRGRLDDMADAMAHANVRSKCESKAWIAEPAPLKIESALKRLPGITDIQVSYATGTLSLRLDEGPHARERLEATIRRLGYTPYR